MLLVTNSQSHTKKASLVQAVSLESGTGYPLPFTHTHKKKQLQEAPVLEEKVFDYGRELTEKLETN